MEKMCKVVITLSGNEHLGRYKLRYSDHDIVQDKPKTIVVVGKTDSARVRHMKSELLKVKSDFKNDRITKLQFYTICLEENLEEAVKLLSIKLKESAEKLIRENDVAWDAFVGGTTLEKIQ